MAPPLLPVPKNLIAQWMADTESQLAAHLEEVTQAKFAKCTFEFQGTMKVVLAKEPFGQRALKMMRNEVCSLKLRLDCFPVKKETTLQPKQLHPKLGPNSGCLLRHLWGW